VSRENGQFDIDGVAAGSYRANGSIMVRVDAATGRGISPRGDGAGAAGAVTFSSVSSTTWSSSSGGRSDAPAEVVVAGADVTGVRVVIQRPARQ
jgi:hypothetical protein